MIDGTAPPELVFGSWDLCHNHARLRLLGFTLKGSFTSRCHLIRYVSSYSSRWA